MKSKKFLVLVSLLLIAALLVACGNSDAGNNTNAANNATANEQESEAADAPTEKSKVVFFVGMGTGTDPDQIEAQEALVTEFNASQDAYEVELLIVPHDSAPERFLAMVSGGNPPDVVGPIGIANVAQFFDVWADVTPFLEEDNLDLSDFYGPAVEMQSYPEKTIGLPLGLYPSFIFYNADLFDAAGLDYPTHDYADTTWNLDTLRATAMELTLDANGNTASSEDFDPTDIVQWGYDDSWTDTRGALTMFGSENVGRPTTADYKTAIANSEEWVYGLQWLSDGIWTDYFIPDATGQEAYYAVGGDPLGGGLVAMFYSHTWFMSEGLIELPFEIDIAPAPYNQKGERISRIHADTYVIPDGAPNARGAWEFIKWMTSADKIVDVCEIYGCVPARYSSQEAYGEMLAERYPGMDYDVLFTAIEYLDTPNHESFVPEWGRVNDALNVAFGTILVEAVDAQEVMDAANAEVQAILDEYWTGQ